MTDTERKESLLERAEALLSQASQYLNYATTALLWARVDAFLSEIRPEVEARRAGKSVPVTVYVAMDCGGWYDADKHPTNLEPHLQGCAVTKATVYARIPEPAKVWGGEGEP